MSKKSTKAKAPKANKADSKPKVKTKAKPEAADATTQIAEAATAEESTTGAAATESQEGQTTEVVSAAPETQTQSADFQIKKDAKGRFWVVAKESGTEHGPYDTKKEATDAKAAMASGIPPAAAGDAAEGGKHTRARKAKEPKEKKLSAIDAAAQVLATSSEPMNCMALVEAMATQGLWESPGGKTPSATLYSAIIREIATKGAESRFVKKDRGMFAKA